MGTERVLTPSVFAPLVAYIGEVMRQSINGRWEMRLERDKKTWVPWVVDPAGPSYSPVRFYKELIEYGRAASSRVFVEGTLGGGRLASSRKTK